MSKAAVSTSIENAKRLMVIKQRLAGKLPSPTAESIVLISGSDSLARSSQLNAGFLSDLAYGLKNSFSDPCMT